MKPRELAYGTVSKDGRTITVECPFCYELHTHGLPTGKVLHNDMRGSHCVGRPAGAYFLATMGRP